MLNSVTFFILAIIAILVTWCFYLARKILVALAIFAHLRTFLGLSSPFYFLSLEFGENYYSCYFCDIYYYVFLASKKNPCYFCDFFHIFGLFGAFLGLFSFLVFNLVTFVILAIFANSHYSLPGVFD